MGTPTTLQLPFTGGLDQKTSRFYLDPNARLATITDGNFVKVGAIDKRAGISYLGATQAGGGRLASWSKGALCSISGSELYVLPESQTAPEAVGPLPSPRVIRRPLPTAPLPSAFGASNVYGPQLNANLCDIPWNGSTLRLAAYLGPLSQTGLAQIFVTVWDANSGDVVLQPQVLFTGAGVPGTGTGPYVAQTIYLPLATNARKVAIILVDPTAATSHGYSYNPATNAISLHTFLPGALAGLYGIAFDAVPFNGDTVHAGFVVLCSQNVAGNYQLNWFYYDSTFTQLATGTVQAGGPVAGTGVNFTPDCYVVATYATSGEHVWFTYGQFSGASPAAYSQVAAAYSGDGAFTPQATTGTAIYATPLSPRLIPPARLTASTIYAGAVGWGLNATSNTYAGWWQEFTVSGSTITQTAIGVWPNGVAPYARAFTGPDGKIYQPAELCLQTQTGFPGAQATQSQQGTLFLLTPGAPNNVLLPVATVAPRQKTIDTGACALGVIPGMPSTPLMSVSALQTSGLTRFACSIRTIGVDTAAAGGVQTPAWSVDFYFDSASQSLIGQAAELGQALHLATATPFVNDSSIAFEDSFAFYPEFAFVTQGGAGSALTGTYTYAVVYTYVDAAGLLHRGVPVFTSPITLGGAQNPTVHCPALSMTWRDRLLSAASGPGSVYAEIYRTTSSAPAPATFYLLARVVVSNLATAPFYAVTPTVFATYLDTTTDANLDVNTLLYTTGGVLDNPCPPCAALQCVHKNRLWIVDETLRVIWFTQAFSAGLAPTWNELMTIQLPDGGDITAIAELDDKLIVFKANSISVIYGGDGLSITGTGSDITNPQRIATDVGALDWRSVVLTPDGLMFLAASGIYLLSRSLEVSFVGVQVVDLLATYPTVVAATLVPSATQVRFECNNGSVSVALVYDYLLKQWTLHTRANVSALVVSACLSSVAAGSVYSLLTSDGNLWQESATSYLDTDSSAVTHFVPTTVSTAWIKLQGVQGYQRARRAMLIAEELDDCGLSMGFSVNYSPTIKQTYSWSSAVMDQLPVFQVEQHVAGAYNKEMALQITVSDIQGVNQTTGQGARFIGLAIELDQIGDRMRQVPAAGKA
jgi:hypothetical protein